MAKTEKLLRCKQEIIDEMTVLDEEINMLEYEIEEMKLLLKNNEEVPYNLCDDEDLDEDEYGLGGDWWKE